MESEFVAGFLILIFTALIACFTFGPFDVTFSEEED
jgi:hypothetical protein